MSNDRNNKLLAAISSVREVFYEAIATRIQFTKKTYSEIAEEVGCSEQTVYQVARLRQLRRIEDKDGQMGRNE